MTGAGPVFTHGTVAGYMRHGCRCEACRAAEVARQRKWRERHRQGKVRHQPLNPNCVPVRIRGTVYPSISVAAAKLGVSPSSIASQLRRKGSAEAAGLGGSAPRPRRQPLNSKTCRIHGRSFPSIAEAARYLGVNYSHLFRQLQRGMKPGYSDYLLSRLIQADAAKGRIVPA